ncbi:hypothetical protein BUALT_Bualt05G0042000 [Buddleja alternifolia]|uniref:Uncharacterized protein n=1 Tax=Buddleja alternifolia TaxID=168488 RepID=A0AAV6XNC8_9LAMI|nr:hypothetical protein BUALT_Bualt05G0042000 [Buddleja alternifolia]
MHAIIEKIVSLNYVNFRAEIKSVDSQESFNVATTTATQTSLCPSCWQRIGAVVHTASLTEPNDFIRTSVSLVILMAMAH